MKKLLLLLTLAALVSCQKDKTTVEDEGVDGVIRPLACSSAAIETQLNQALTNATTDADFTLLVERSDGRQYSFSRGTSNASSLYESASTSKLVSSIIILRLVDQGYLNLTDKPQKYISSWPIVSTDSLYNINLAQLLSFTSGLETEPLCLNAGSFDFENCVRNIATTNSGNGVVPGSKFYYSSTHMQVAGLMAIKAKGVSSWQDIFNSFKSETGLFSSGSFDLPSNTNPRLAGGMHWKGSEYLAFLRALKNGTLLSTNLQSQLLMDQTANVAFGNSPAVNALGEMWHYGFGLWHECQNSTYTCTPGVRVSSPGSYGAYPFWDRQKNYIGILARQGALETFKNGALLERVVRTSLDEWADCTND